MTKGNWYTVVLFALICFSGSLHAGGSLSPAMVPGSKTVSVNEAKKLFDDGAVFIDVRSVQSWKRGRIPKSVHLDLLKDFSEESLSSCVSNKSTGVVIYCNGPHCLRSSIASAKAIKWGYEKVYYFRDGFPAWIRADYPVVSVGNVVEVESLMDPRV